MPHGLFDGIKIRQDMIPYVVEQDIWVKNGEHISAFRGANDSIGTIVLNFDKETVLESALGNIKDWLKVIVQ